MTPLRPTHSLAILTVLGLSAALVLSGCSLLPSIPFPGGGSSENQQSGDGDTGNDSDSSLEDGIEDNPFLEQTVPDTFPASIPRPDLEVLLGMDLGAGWSIAYKTDQAISDFDALTQSFSSEGWEELSKVSGDGQAFAVYDSSEYQVQINAATEDTGYDTPILSMTVVRKD